MPSPKSKTRPKPDTAWQFEAIGTAWSIETAEPLPPGLKTEIITRIDEFDADYSRFRADSLVTAMSKTAGTYRLPADAKPLLDLYEHLYAQTDGAMTPLIGNTLSDAGYDADYSLTPKQLTVPSAWKEALEYQFPTLTLLQPVLLDFGAAGKGYLVDIVSELLGKHAIAEYIVNAGGDLRQRHHTDAAKVGLEHPDHADEVIGIVNLHNQSLCGSAGNRRAWGDFHHIIDPRLLRSPRHIKAVWVVADTTLVADALATCLFFVEPEIMQKYYPFEHAIVYADGSLKHSPDFPATFFGD